MSKYVLFNIYTLILVEVNIFFYSFWILTPYFLGVRIL